MDCASADTDDMVDGIRQVEGEKTPVPSSPVAILHKEEDAHNDASADNLRKLPCGVVAVQIDCNNGVEADSVPVGVDILLDAQHLLSPLSAFYQT